MKFVVPVALLLTFLAAPALTFAKSPVSKFVLPMQMEIHPRLTCSNLMSSVDPEEVRARILDAETRLNEKVPGQTNTNFKVITTAVAGGHLLLIGPTGVAKTRTTSVTAKLFGATGSKIEVRGDMMPQQVTGKVDFNEETRQYELIKSLLPYQFVMLDEANRGSERLQTAFLNAMQDKEFRVDDFTIPMPHFHMFIATQNPSHHKGTTGLNEALLDRFTLAINVPYPDPEVEREIIRIVEQEKRDRILNPAKASEDIAVASPEDLLLAQLFSLNLEVSDDANAYIETLVQISRAPEAQVSSELGRQMREALGPRVSIDLTAAGRAVAWLKGAEKVERQHVELIVDDVIRHRIHLSEQAVQRGVKVEEVIRNLRQATRRQLEQR